MKGRPKSIRKITSIPTVSGFIPYGGSAEETKGERIFLLYEEYEAFRLNDYEHHTHCESAAIMGVSRPTFTRIYMSARQKIAQALIEGKRIVIEGGKVQLDSNWRICSHCGAIFSSSGAHDERCALCGSQDVRVYRLEDADE